MILLAISVGSFLVFTKIESRHPEPVIDFALLRNRLFWTGTYCSGINLVASYGIQFLMPIFLTTVGNLDAVTTGLLLVPQAAMRLLFSPVSGILYDKVGPRKPVTIGLVTSSASLIIMGLLKPSFSKNLIVLALALDGISAALIWAPTLNAVLRSAPSDRISSVTGIFNMLRFIMATVGTVIVGIILDIFFRGSMRLDRAVPGFVHAYLIMAVMTLIGIIPARKLPRKKYSTSKAQGEKLR